MAVNLMTKYASKLAEGFNRESYTALKCSTEFDFVGVKSIKVMSTLTQELNDYARSGASRYGVPKDVQDALQEMTLTQDKSFSLVIDKGDNSEQMMLKNAGKMMRKQQRERVVPAVDKWNLKKWAEGAGKVVVSAAPSKTTIVALLLAAETHLDDSFVPANERYAYMSNAKFELIRLAAEFAGCDAITDKLIIKGMKGNIGTLQIITVPASHMPANVHFLVTYKNSVLAPHKIHEAKIHKDPPGISGHLMEGRDIFDAFVVGENCNGVYACVLTDKKGTTPTATKAATTSLAAGAGEIIKYTLDGSDPRYSATAITYSSAFANPEAGVIIKAFAQKYADGIFGSDVLVHTAV